MNRIFSIFWNRYRWYIGRMVWIRSQIGETCSFICTLQYKVRWLTFKRVLLPHRKTAFYFSDNKQTANSALTSTLAIEDWLLKESDRLLWEIKSLTSDKQFLDFSATVSLVSFNNNLFIKILEQANIVENQDSIF